MPYVIRRKADGHYSKGRSYYFREFTADLARARVYTTRGNATLSLRQVCTRSDHETAFEVVEVKLVEVS